MATQDPFERLEERLAAIEARLDRIAGALAPLEARAPALEPALDLACQVEPAIAMAADTLDEWAARQIRRGVDVDARLSHALALLEQLTDPAIAAQLERLVALLPKLLPVAEIAATFEPTTAMLFDMADETVQKLDARGIDAEERIRRVMGLVERLTEPAFHAHLNELLDAAPGLMAATRTGELFGRALDEAMTSSPEPVGMFGLLGALSRPEVQRVLGLAIAVADRVGQQIPKQTLQRS